jgi:proteasome lid subunit RPN8/RPN11
LVFWPEEPDGRPKKEDREYKKMLTIKNADYDQLRRHGEETYPFECCGVLLGQFTGQDRVVQEVIRCGNTRADRPQDRYHIDPKELIRIQRQATARDRDIVGFYHSHPDHPARWSQTDLAEAHWMGCSYVITSVERGQAHDTNAFVLLGDTEENKRLETEEIHVAGLVEDRTLCR